MFVLFVMQSYLIEVRGLKQKHMIHFMSVIKSYLIEVRGLKLFWLGARICIYSRTL